MTSHHASRMSISIDESSPLPQILKARISVNHGQSQGPSQGLLPNASASPLRSPSSPSASPSSPSSSSSSSPLTSLSPTPLNGKFSFAEFQHIYSDLYGHPLRISIRLKDFLSSLPRRYMEENIPKEQIPPPPSSCVVLYAYDAAIRRYKYINRTELVSSTHDPIYETTLVISADQKGIYSQNESQSHEYIRSDVLLFYIFTYEWEAEDDQLQIDMENGNIGGGYPCIDGYTACAMMNYNELLHNKGGKIQFPIHNIHSIEWNEILRESHSYVIIQQILPEYLKINTTTTTSASGTGTLNNEYMNRLRIMNSQQVWTRAVTYDEENQPPSHLFSLSPNISFKSSPSSSSPASSPSSLIPQDFLPLLSIWYRSASNASWELIGDYWDPLADLDTDSQNDNAIDPDLAHRTFIFPYHPPSLSTTINDHTSFQLRLHNRFTLKSMNLSHFSEYYNELKSHPLTVAFGAILSQREIIQFFTASHSDAIQANASGTPSSSLPSAFYPLKFLINEECPYVKSHPSFSSALEILNISLHLQHKPVHGPLEEIPSSLPSPASFLSPAAAAANKLPNTLVEKLLQKCKEHFSTEGIKLHTYITPNPSAAGAKPPVDPSSPPSSSSIVRTVMYYRESPTPRLTWMNYKSYKTILERYPQLAKVGKINYSTEKENIIQLVDQALDAKRGINVNSLSTLIGGKTHPAFYLDNVPPDHSFSDNENLIFANLNDFQCLSIYNDKKSALHVSTEDFDVVSNHDIKMLSSPPTSAAYSHGVGDTHIMDKRSDLILLRNAFIWMILKIALQGREKEIEEKMNIRATQSNVNPEDPIIVDPIVNWQMDKLVPTAPKYFKPTMPNRLPPKSPLSPRTAPINGNPMSPSNRSMSNAAPLSPTGSSFSLISPFSSALGANGNVPSPFSLDANVDFGSTKDEEEKSPSPPPAATISPTLPAASNKQEEKDKGDEKKSSPTQNTLSNSISADQKEEKKGGKSEQKDQITPLKSLDKPRESILRIRKGDPSRPSISAPPATTIIPPLLANHVRQPSMAFSASSHSPSPIPSAANSHNNSTSPSTSTPSPSTSISSSSPPTHSRQQSIAKSSHDRRVSSLDLGLLLGKVQSLLENGRNFARWLSTKDHPQLISIFLTRENTSDTEKYPLGKQCSLWWGRTNKKEMAVWRSLKFEEIEGIVLGKQTSVLRKECCELSPSSCCFTVIGRNHSLHLQTNSERETETMVFGLASLIKSYQKVKPKLYQSGQLVEKSDRKKKEEEEEREEEEKNKEIGYVAEEGTTVPSNNNNTSPSSSSEKSRDSVSSNDGTNTRDSTSKKRRSTVIINNNVDGSFSSPSNSHQAAFVPPRPTITSLSPSPFSSSSPSPSSSPLPSSFSISLIVKCRSLPLKNSSSICCLFDRDESDDSIQYLCQSDKVNKSNSPDYLKHFSITVMYDAALLAQASRTTPSPILLPLVKMRLSLYDIPANSKSMEDDYRVGSVGFSLNEISIDEGIDFIYKLSHEDFTKQSALNKSNSQIILQCVGRVNHSEEESKGISPPTNASKHEGMTIFAASKYPNGVVPQTVTMGGSGNGSGGGGGSISGSGSGSAGKK